MTFIGLFFIFSGLITITSTQRSPTISYITQEEIKDVGDEVQFLCTVQDAEEYPVYWAKVDKEMSVDPIPISSGKSMILRDGRFGVNYDSNTSTYHLRIVELQETDAGVYRCQLLIGVTSAVGIYFSVTAETQLHIRRQPIIYDNSTRSLVAIESQSVKLECYAGGYPFPSVSWKRSGNAVFPVGGSVYRGNIYPIKNVTKDDRGTYYCVAENGVGIGARRNIAVEVQFAPVVTANRNRVGQALRSDIDLQCEIEAYPAPAITWLKNDVVLSNGHTFLMTHFTTTDEITYTNLRVFSIGKRQYGTYVCRAANIFGTSEAKIELYESLTPMCPPACG